MTPARLQASVGISTSMSVLAGLAFHRAFGWSGLIVVVLTAAVFPAVLVSALTVRQRRSLALSMLLSWLAWLAVVTVTLFRGHLSTGLLSTPAAVGSAMVGVRDAWKTIATTILPAPDTPELLVFVNALVWLASFSGAEMALRTRALLAPAIPALLVFGIALLLGTGGPGSDLGFGMGLVVLGGAMVVLRSPEPLWEGGSLAGLASICCLALVAGAVGPNLPGVRGRQPFDLHQHMPAPPPDLKTAISPLDEVQGWLLQNPQRPLFSVRTSQPENWRLAVLDRFDGSQWTTSATLLPTGSRVPAVPGGAARDTGQLVEQDFTIDGLPGPWLPAADRPASVTGVSIDVDPASGVLVAAGHMGPGSRYHVSSYVSPPPPIDRLRSINPARDAEAAADLALWDQRATNASTRPAESTSESDEPQPAAGCADPQLRPPEELRCWAQQATAGSTFPLQEAVLLQNFLLHNEAYDPAAPPGHTFRNLEFFLNTTHHGTSEQFAAAFALMARTLDLPSRVVVGFRAGHAVGDQWEVERGDAMVWPEIDFQGLGWLPFYPTPDSATSAAASLGVPVGESQRRHDLDTQIASAAMAPVPVPTADSRPHQPRRSATTARRRWLVWGLGVAAGLAALLYLGLALLVPVGRRWRRRRGSTAARIAGAWLEVLDELRGMGLRVRSSMTAQEITVLAAGALGPEVARHMAPLAELVNRVRFAAVPPQEEEATTAWQHRAAVGDLAMRTTGPMRRLGNHLNPRRLPLSFA